MDKVTLIPYESIYENFIDKKYLSEDFDEYYFRNHQVKKPENGWRHTIDAGRNARGGG